MSIGQGQPRLRTTRCAVSIVHGSSVLAHTPRAAHSLLGIPSGLRAASARRWRSVRGPYYPGVGSISGSLSLSRDASAN